MALNAILTSSRYKLHFSDGVDMEGKQKYATKSFYGVKPDAVVDTAFGIMQQLTGLQSRMLLKIEKIDYQELQEV